MQITLECVPGNNQYYLSNEDKVSCSRKQCNPYKHPSIVAFVIFCRQVLIGTGYADYMYCFFNVLWYWPVILPLNI